MHGGQRVQQASSFVGAVAWERDSQVALRHCRGQAHSLVHGLCDAAHEHPCQPYCSQCAQELQTQHPCDACIQAIDAVRQAGLQSAHGLGVELVHRVNGSGVIVKVLGRREGEFSRTDQILVGHAQRAVHLRFQGFQRVFERARKQRIVCRRAADINGHVVLQLVGTVSEADQYAFVLWWQRATGQKTTAHGTHDAQLFCQPRCTVKRRLNQVEGVDRRVVHQSEFVHDLGIEPQDGGDELRVLSGAVGCGQLPTCHSLLQCLPALLALSPLGLELFARLGQNQLGVDLGNGFVHAVFDARAALLHCRIA